MGNFIEIKVKNAIEYNSKHLTFQYFFDDLRYISGLVSNGRLPPAIITCNNNTIGINLEKVSPDEKIFYSMRLQEITNRLNFFKNIIESSLRGMQNNRTYVYDTSTQSFY